MSRWQTEKHFTSWLGLAPQTHQSGKMASNGKTKRERKRKTKMLGLTLVKAV
jgi:transposase